MAVSVVVCAKNEEGYIADCLSSLRKQTIKPEIIVIDGCSQDRTREIARRFTKKVYSDRGKGIAAARNLGWARAKHSIVAYCDADARPPSDWIEKIIASMNGCIAVHGPIVPYDGDLKTKINLKIWGNWFLHLCSLIKFPCICGANVAFRKWAIRKFPFRLNTPIEDFDVGQRMRSAGKIKFVPELVMPISSRRYKGKFYRTVFRDYLANYARILLGRQPKVLGYFDRK